MQINENKISIYFEILYFFHIDIGYEYCNQLCFQFTTKLTKTHCVGSYHHRIGVFLVTYLDPEVVSVMTYQTALLYVDLDCDLDLDPEFCPISYL